MRKVIIAVVLAVTLAACSSVGGGGNQSAIDKAKAKAANNNVYIPKNHLELDNYNKRQQIADDPSTILWCTFAFPVTGAKLVTIPIVGKLTSGAKRPFPEHQVVDFSNTDSNNYSPDLPGADGMYGSSGDYRYGFTPDNAYSDFYNLATYCTTAPMIWQKEQTTIAIGVDPTLNAASLTAQAQLKNGNKTGASDTLQNAVDKVGAK